MKAIMFLIILLVGPLAWAQPESMPVMFDLPRGVTIATGKTTYRGYTLEEFKIILHIYTDYKSWGKQLPKIRLQRSILENLTANLKKQLELRAAEVEKLESERKLLTEKWKEENRLRHSAENRPAFGSWIVWGTAALTTAVAAVLTVVLITKD